MLKALMPVRKRGRPTNSELALEKDKDIDVMALQPGNWRKSKVYHPLHKHGMVYSWRNAGGKNGIHWYVRFMDSPDGIVELEWNQDELANGLGRFREWEGKASHTDSQCA